MKMADSWFETLSEEKIAELLNDKDNKKTQKAKKGSRLIFEAYRQEKNIRYPAEDSGAEELTPVLRKNSTPKSFFRKYFE